MHSAKDKEDRSAAEGNLIGRRGFLVGAGVAAIGATWWWSMGRQPISAEAAAAGKPKMVTIIGFKDDGTRTTKESRRARCEKRSRMARSSFRLRRLKSRGARRRSGRSRVNS